MKKHYRHENDCLNCGAALQGKYCHACGQENLQIKESFGHMMNHAISDYFHFDHQFFHTLKPLLFKPGYLTNEYMAGKRVQYLHPVKMYIFISLVYFVLLFQSSHEVVTTNRSIPQTAKTEHPKDLIDKGIDSAKKEIDKDHDLSAQQKAAIKKGITRSTVISDYGIIKISDDAKGPNGWFHPSTKDTSYQQYLASQQKMPEKDQDNFLLIIWNKKVFDFIKRYGPGAKDAFLDELKHNTPKMMFLILPLFAMMLRVVFWKSKKFYVEHLIYAFHFYCFLFLFLVLIMLLQAIIPGDWGAVIGWIKALTALYVLWYSYRSLRNVYHRSRFRTITKIIGMSFIYFFIFSFCICLLFLVTTMI